MMAVQTTLDARATCPTTCAPLRTRDRARGAARPHRQRRPRRPRRVARDSPTRVRRRRGRELEPRLQAHRREAPAASRRGNARRRTSARSAPATTSSRSASTRRTASGSCCTRGSRGVGNRIGTLLHRAREGGHAPLRSSTCRTRTSRTCRRAREHFDDYVEAVQLGAGLRATQPRADDATRWSTALQRARRAARRSSRRTQAVNCHHNYVAREHHYGEDVLVTRKGAVRARRGRARHHPGQHGRALVHRARQGQPGELRELQPRRGPRDVAHRGASSASRSRTTRRRPRASSAARTRT